VLLGVNADRTSEDLVSAQARYDLSWRSWWDNGGKIAGQYGVGVLPSIFLIDHEGNVQQSYSPAPNPKKLDAAIEELVRKAEK
jgi:hypothetical protein